MSFAFAGLLACAGSGDKTRDPRLGGGSGTNTGSGSTGASGSSGKDGTGGDPFNSGSGTGGRTAPTLQGDASVGDGGGRNPDQLGNCGGTEVVPVVKKTTIPGNILFVFDRSGSMRDPWGSATGNSKWKDAIAAVTAAVTALQDQITAAAVFFPTDGNECEVVGLGTAPQIDFMPGPDFLKAWTANVSTRMPNGSTPLLSGLKIADTVLQAALPSLTGKVSVVVITDGAPNCRGGVGSAIELIGNLTPVVDNWLKQSVQTHVVGLPGVDAAATTLLGALAVAGGTTRYIPADDIKTLQTELANIVSASVITSFEGCSLPLDTPPPNLDYVSVVVVEKGKRQAVARDLGTGGGWVITPDGKSIVLQGLFCDNAKAGTYSKISAVFGCIELPPLPPPSKPGPE